MEEGSEDIPLDSVATIPPAAPPVKDASEAPTVPVTEAPEDRDPRREERLRKLRDTWFTGVQFLDNVGIESKWTVVPALDMASERIRVHWFEDMFRAQTAHFPGPNGGDTLAEAVLTRPSLLNLCWGSKYTTGEDLCGTRVVETFPGNLSLVEFSLRRRSVFPWIMGSLRQETRTLTGLFWYRHDPSKRMHIFLFQEFAPLAAAAVASARFCLLIRTPNGVPMSAAPLSHVSVFASNSLLRQATGGHPAEHLRATLLGWEENIIK
jgi:hypothetical protein